MELTCNNNYIWRGLMAVDGNGKAITDDEAVAYAIKKFDVDEKQIILERTGGCILVRPVVASDNELTFLTFEHYKQKMCGFPMLTDPNYATCRDFGYDAWLLATYHEEVCNDPEFLAHLEEDYHWYRLETYLGVNFESDLDDIEKFLFGKRIFKVDDSVMADIDCVIFIWHDLNAMEFVLLASIDGLLIPALLPISNLISTNKVFGGFDE